MSDTTNYFGGYSDRRDDVNIDRIFDNIERGVNGVNRVVDAVRRPYEDSRRNNNYPNYDAYGNPVNGSPYGAPPAYDAPQYAGYGWGDSPYGSYQNSYLYSQTPTNEGYPGIYNVNYGLTRR